MSQWHLQASKWHIAEPQPSGDGQLGHLDLFAKKGQRELNPLPVSVGKACFKEKTIQIRRAEIYGEMFAANFGTNRSVSSAQPFTMSGSNPSPELFQLGPSSQGARSDLPKPPWCIHLCRWRCKEGSSPWEVKQKTGVPMMLKALPPVFSSTGTARFRSCELQTWDPLFFGLWCLK